MSIYLRLFFIALVVVYIVDLSGFTESWRGAFARWLKKPALHPLPPFDCGQCMVWWVTTIRALCLGQLNEAVAAYCAALAFSAIVLGLALDTLRETIISLINKLRNLL